MKIKREYESGERKIIKTDQGLIIVTNDTTKKPDLRTSNEKISATNAYNIIKEKHKKSLEKLSADETKFIEGGDPNDAI